MDWNSVRVLASLVSCVVTVNINESVVRIYDCYVLAKNCCTASMHYKDNQKRILYIEGSISGNIIPTLQYKILNCASLE